jgi:hypothetical protein
MPPNENPGDNKASGTLIHDAGVAAAADLEKTYQADGPAAAAAKLQAEYLDSIKNPVQDAVHLTKMDYEITRLQTDSLKHDETLLACATEWGIQLLQNIGGIDQQSLEKIASTGQTGETSDSPVADPYGQLMASTLDQNWQQLEGFGGRSTDPMAKPTITYLGLLKSRDVDEEIRTYKPEPPKPPSLIEKIENFF